MQRQLASLAEADVGLDEGQSPEEQNLESSVRPALACFSP